MRVAELRIGNYIQGSMYFDTEEAKDDLGESYSEDLEWVIDTVMGICHPAEDFLYWGELEHEVHRVKPIPLTEDLLLKLGFEYYYVLGKYRFVIEDVWYMITLTEDGKFLFSFINLNYDEVFHMPPKVIESVNELQNLFYALSKKDLKWI